MSAPLMSAQQWLIERDANGREWPFKALFFSFPQSQSSSLRPGLQTRRDWLVCSHSMFFALRRRISCVSTCCSTFMHLLLFYCCRTPSLTEDESRHLTVLAPREAEAYLLESHRFAVKKKRKKVTQIFYYLRLLTDNERNPRNVQCERGIAHFQQSSRSPPPLDCPTSIRAPFKNPSLCTESQSWPKDFFPPPSSPVQPHKSLISIYIFILIWHVIRNRSHAAIGEHSDVPSESDILITDFVHTV